MIDVARLHAHSGCPVLPVIIPFRNLWDAYTRPALSDVIRQKEVETAPILLDNLSDLNQARKAVAWTFAMDGRSDYIRMPGTVDALWNAGLDYAFNGLETDVAAVINNDVRLNPDVLATLYHALRKSDALFLSAVGVRDESWKQGVGSTLDSLLSMRGGPDYSCFLITRRCWDDFPFDEKLSYCGDLDHHRRLMLAGHGKRIFGISIPYWHIGSATIKQSEQELQAHHNRNARHLEYYAEKWGGGPNEERWLVPFAGQAPQGDACTSTPLIHRHGCRGVHEDHGASS